MKILFNAYNPALHGGPATHLRLLEEELMRQVEVRPFQYQRKSDTEPLPAKVLGRARDLARLHRLIVNERPDVVHHNSALDPRALFRDVPLSMLVRWHRVPLFLKFHGTSPETLASTSPLIRYGVHTLLDNASCIGVLSPLERTEMINAVPQVAEKVQTVKNIIDPEFFAAERSEHVSPLVLFVSRFVREKGMYDLLECVPAVLRKWPDANFVFIGSGPEDRTFDAEVSRRGLSKSVTHCPHMKNADTIRYYASAWVFAFPTEFPEGMPMVVAQALAVGVPLVTTRTRFSLSYMKEGRHCLYAGRRDPGALAEKIGMLLQDEAQRRRMSEANRLLAQEFSPGLVANEFLTIYRRLAK
jgi:glycosyltransferase involved in cell wall biosynthesis